jgi:hypothetical protein
VSTLPTVLFEEMKSEMRHWVLAGAKHLGLLIDLWRTDLLFWLLGADCLSFKKRERCEHGCFGRTRGSWDQLTKGLCMFWKRDDIKHHFNQQTDFTRIERSSEKKCLSFP